MFDINYFLYMSEAEGLDTIVSTRTAKLNAIINDFISLVRKGVNLNDHDLQEAIFYHHKINPTEKELLYIQREVEKRA